MVGTTVPLAGARPELIVYEPECREASVQRAADRLRWQEWFDEVTPVQQARPLRHQADAVAKVRRPRHQLCCQLQAFRALGRTQQIGQRHGQYRCQRSQLNSGPNVLEERVAMLVDRLPMAVQQVS